MKPNRDLAKNLIVEILRQSDEGLGKTLLFKAFWIAHLYYAKSARGYLTDWPIVRMPNGPGIDGGESLLKELVDAKIVHKTHVPKGPYTETNYKLADRGHESGLSSSAIDAIVEAVKDIGGLTATSASRLSHDFSRSWNNTPNGAELDIYTDLIPDDVYEERKTELLAMKKAYEDLFE